MMRRKQLRKRMLTMLVAGVCTLAALTTANADIGTEQWNSTYYSPAGWHSGIFWGIGFHPDGSLLASGHRSEPDSSTAVGVRYNTANGAALDSPVEWILYPTTGWGDYTHDRFYGQFIEADGDIYLAGSGRNDSGLRVTAPALLKYKKTVTGTSEMLWEKRYTPNATQHGGYNGVAVNAAGEVYAAGWFGKDSSSAVGNDWFVHKFDSSGVESTGFPLIFDYMGLDDGIESLAIDSEGNFIVAGYVTVDATVDHRNWFVRKYSADGTQVLWEEDYDHKGLSDSAQFVTLDSEDNVIVSGYINNGTAATADNDWYIVKYTKDGNGSGGATRLWEQSWDIGNTSGVAYGMVTDSQDNIYIVGAQINVDATSRAHIQYRDGQTGTLLKSQELSHTVTINDNPTAEHDYIRRIALNGGQLVVAGYTHEAWIHYGQTARVAMLELLSDVTPSVSGNGTISPSTKVENIAYNTTTDFTLTPDTSHHILDVTGTCPVGTLSDNGDGTWNYTTGAIVADCTVIANFFSFTLTYTAGANGSITGDTFQAVASGGNGTAVTAVPATGYHFVDWSDGGSNNPRTDTNVTADIDVTANFATGGYTLTYTAGPGGSISGDTPQTVNHGSAGTAVTAVPATGYHFVDWSDGGSDNPRTDTNVTADIDVAANFAIDTFTLTYTAGPGGSISGATPQTVNYGAAGAAVTAVPATGYHFVDWSDKGSDNPRTDTNVTADIDVAANFAIDTFTLTYTAGSNGSISGATPQTVNYGAAGAAVTAVPATGYHFVDWSDGESDNPRTDTNVTADIDVTANFVIDTFTLTYTAGPGGSISGATPQTVNYGTAGAAVTAVPATGYHFVDWSDGGSNNPRTDTNVTADIDVTANFAIDTFTLTYTASSNGSISGATPQTVNHGSAGAAVTAVPDTGYRFVDWSDRVTNNPRTDTNVMTDIDVTANFDIAFTLSVVFSGPGSGTVTSDPAGIDCMADCSADFLHDTSVILTAVADEKSKFAGWSGDGCTGIDPCTVTMDQARDITATFNSGFPWNLFLPAIMGTRQK
ncbi:MAG: InlB B-repeat-containing protein [Desulfocapsa sp.]|nr:InlB B-repeat-containing protein [Desulfocapsa sp.]